METTLCAAVGTASDQHGLEACTVYGDDTMCSCRHSKRPAWVRRRVLCMENTLCAAVGTASDQHELEACTVYGDDTVCSCRHSKLPAWVRSVYCVQRPHCVQL